MAKLLSTSQVESYEQDGLVFPVTVLAAEEAAQYLSMTNELERQMGGRPRPTDLSMLNLHFRWAYDLACHPKVLDAVEDVLGPDIIAWATGLFPKHPRDPGYISWHQDGKYWKLDSTQLVTAWIALSNSTVENGCMRGVPGSHRKQYLPHKDTYAEDNQLSRGQEIEVDVDESDAVDIVLRAGEMSLHHVKLIHGSNANSSDEQRMGFAIRYVTPQLEQVGYRPKGVLARGQDNCGNFELIDEPEQMDMQASIEAMRHTVKMHMKSVMPRSG